jgi:hypothetical protein
MSEDEVKAEVNSISFFVCSDPCDRVLTWYTQMKVLILAGYETTSSLYSMLPSPLSCN